ncbi:MAG TPA: NAD(P)/FAD-dependent oxidoreductase [Opitutales bacterium]|nr:NAD(P)/FAD-dependent oxidoreductase [Opitutales bacterium]
MNHKSETYNVIVIGGGTAGANAARAAVDSGAQRVGLIRNPVMSNTCVRQGCMPSKAALAHAAKGLSLGAALDHKRHIIQEFEEDLDKSLEEESFHVIWGRASFIDENSVQVETARGRLVLTARRFVIATGARGFIPPIEGLRELQGPLCFTSDDFMGPDSVLDHLPAKLLILGAGPIGLEAATFFSRLGCEVIVIEMLDRILPFMDPEFCELRLRAAREPDAFTIQTGCTMKALEKKNGSLCAIVESKENGGKTFSAEAVMVATGRKPDFEGLKIERAGLSLEKGKIPHDKRTLATKNPSIFLAGDATGHDQILHIAARMGRIAGTNAASAKAAVSMDYAAVDMAIVFEEHPSAAIGMSEEKARKAGVKVITAARDLSDVGRGLTDEVKFGRIKLVVDEATGQVIGGQMLGPSASEVIHALSPVISMGGTTNDMVKATWYHPTYSELWHTLANDICQSDSTLCPGT